MISKSDRRFRFACGGAILLWSDRNHPTDRIPTMITLEKLSATDAQAILDGLDRPEVIAFPLASKPH